MFSQVQCVIQLVIWLPLRRKEIQKISQLKMTSASSKRWQAKDKISQWFLNSIYFSTPRMLFNDKSGKTWPRSEAPDRLDDGRRPTIQGRTSPGLLAAARPDGCTAPEQSGKSWSVFSWSAQKLYDGRNFQQISFNRIFWGGELHLVIVKNSPF